MSEPQSPQPRNRSRSSPAPIVGRGQSSAAILPLPRNTTAFPLALSFAAISPLGSSVGRPHLARQSPHRAPGGARPAPVRDGGLAARRHRNPLVLHREAAVLAF